MSHPPHVNAAVQSGTNQKVNQATDEPLSRGLTALQQEPGGVSSPRESGFHHGKIDGACAEPRQHKLRVQQTEGDRTVRVPCFKPLDPVGQPSATAFQVSGDGEDDPVLAAFPK